MRHIDMQSSSNKGRSVVVEIDENNCYNVISHALNQDGYFRKLFYEDGKKVLKMYHRFVWERSGRAIPEGYEIDHICRNRRCCNLDHLQLLGISEHKAKTNKERYAERIESVIKAIQSGLSNKEISKEYNVTPEYVNRYRRNLNGASSI